MLSSDNRTHWKVEQWKEKKAINSIKRGLISKESYIYFYNWEIWAADFIIMVLLCSLHLLKFKYFCFYYILEAHPAAGSIHKDKDHQAK